MRGVKVLQRLKESLRLKQEVFLRWTGILYKRNREGFQLPSRLHQIHLSLCPYRSELLLSIAPYLSGRVNDTETFLLMLQNPHNL